MKYLEVLSNNLMEYKRQGNISLVNLLNFAYDIINCEKKSSKNLSALMEKCNWIKDNTHEKINMPLLTFEFIFQKNKGVSTTSKPLFIRTNKGWRSFYYSQLLKIWQETFFNISNLQTHLLKDYSFEVKYSNKSDKISGLEEAN